MFAEIKKTLHDFGVDFDVYFHEDDLHKSGAVDAGRRAAERARQHLREGRRALARTEKYGDDKDRVIIKSDGQRRLPVRRPGLLPRQAGARLRPLLHHARRRPPRLRRPDDGDVRGVRRRAARQPRDPDRPAGQPAQGRPAAADVQAGRHRRHHRRPGRGDRRRRRPLRPGALRSRHARSTSTSTCGPRRPTTTRSSTCSTPTPGSARSCATPPTSGSSRPTPSTPSCSPTRRRASCSARSPSSRGSSPPRPSCASRTGWRATSRTRPASYHRFYDNCRVLPMGDEEPDRPPPRPAAAGRGDPRRARQRPRPARRLRPGADVSAD